MPYKFEIGELIKVNGEIARITGIQGKCYKVSFIEFELTWEFLEWEISSLSKLEKEMY
jgi:hypothetical protein